MNYISEGILEGILYGLTFLMVLFVIVIFWSWIYSMFV